ncbi:Protein of unknown function [Soonwooa buanensis]|uniref:DUF2931 family protein n=1 Tax=Soonwooa buanensis TaxID=619805 RepID=A0A1T5GHS7_9FLAO|nr:DUF2931 family protein [Soonwooa buanensis]SKC07877.1 Protein of unknown function [Soonwooa buanensis]
MFKNRVNIINLGLFLILVGFCVAFFIQLKKDKYFDKKVWYWYLTTEDAHQHYKIIEYQLIYNDNEYDGIWQAEYQILNPKNATNFNNLGYAFSPSLYSRSSTKPYPHSLKLKWFCYEDETFYEAETKLPSQKIEELTENLKSDPCFVAKILPNGKLEFGLTKSLAGFKSDSPFEDENKIETTSLGTFQGKKIPENLNLLRSDGDRFEDVKILEDYMFVYKTQVNWGIKVDYVKNLNAKIVFATDFLQNDFKFTDFKNNTTSLETNLFPQKLQLQYYEDESGFRYDFFPDRMQLMEVYDTLLQKSKSKDFYFVFKLNKTDNLFDVYLENSGSEVKLKNVVSINKIQEN